MLIILHYSRDVLIQLGGYPRRWSSGCARPATTSAAAQSLSDIAAQCLVAHRPSFARPLLTEDKDFGELVFRSRMAAPGVVLLRLDIENGPAKWLRLEAAIAEFGDRVLGRYIVIEARRFRSRPLLRSAS